MGNIYSEVFEAGISGENNQNSQADNGALGPPGDAGAEKKSATDPIGLAEALRKGFYVDPDARSIQGVLLRRLDPRPDLASDHATWILLLSNAAHLSGMDQLYGILHWMRCSGAGVERNNGALGFKLTAGHWDTAAAGMPLDAVKARYLVHVKDTLVQLFEECKSHGELPNTFPEGGVKGKQEKMNFMEGE